MPTANQIIAQSLGLLGIKAPGEGVEGDESADILIRLNTMLDAYRLESLNAYTLQRVTASVSTVTRTIGPAGNFVIDPRPVRIERGSFYSSGGTDYTIEPVSAEQYNSLLVKANGGLGPQVVYLDTAFPTGTLFFYPVPLVVVTVTLLCQVQISAFPDLTTNFLLPTGYERMLVFSLAEEVAADYEREIPPTVARNATNARRAVKRVNSRVPTLQLPSGLPGQWGNSGYPYG